MLTETRPKGKPRAKDRDQWERLLMKRTVTLNGGGGCQTGEGTINNGDVIVPIVPIILKKKKRLDVGVDVTQFQRKEKSLSG